MVDLSACVVSDRSYWTHIGWRWFQLLIQPQVALPLLIALTLLPRLRPRRPWKRRLSQTGLVLVIGYSLLSLPWAARLGGQGLMWMTPADRGQPAEAIVVLGRGPDFRPSRVAVAVDLWEQGRAPLIFASGGGDATELGEMLAAAGVPRSAIEGEPCSATTNENAEFTAALLQPQGIRRIVLVTDRPHLLRSTLTFRSFGFEVIPHPSPVPSSLSERQQHRLVVREWAGLVSYGLLGRYFTQSVTEPSFLATAPDSYPAPY